MYTLGLGVAYDPARPAWRQWQPGQAVDPYDIPDEILDKWVETRPGQPGWQATSRSGQVGCYCWGYRPANRPLSVDGVRWSYQQTPWKICEFACSTPACPTPPPCPAPTPCPPQTVCPHVEPTTCEHPQDIERSKNWLWAIGFGVLVVGVYGVRRTMALRRR